MLAAAILLALPTAAVRPETRPGRVAATLPLASGGLAGEVRVEADHMEQTREGDALLEGAVTLRWNRSRMQADRIVFREKRFIEAEGNVLVVWGGNRVSGSRMRYDLRDDRGTIEDAIGQVEPEFHFTADRVEKVGKDLVRLESATVTTCTQPVPYWSFSVSGATVRLDEYAHMRNLRLKAGRVPVFYLPYLVWPVKRDRAAGLLFPQFGTTRNRGQVISEEVFFPLGPSADLTVLGEYYSRAGFGGGGEFRWVPNRKGSAVLNAFYIDDKVAGFGRYRATYRQTQEFLNGFRMVADVNQVSDFDFFTDYEREIRLASSPTILARVELTRNGDWTSVNVRELRREQLFFDGSSLVQQTLPEIELRGRSRRLGRSPVYVSYESSVASIQQRGARVDADYRRADLFPTLSAPVSPLPWLDVTPSVSYRLTYYSQHRRPQASPSEPVRVVDESLVRDAMGAGVEVVGPKFSRVFQTPREESASKYKHTIEPRFAYDYQQGTERNDEILLFDEVDRLIEARNRLTYGLRSRLFARRARSDEPVVPQTLEAIVLPDGTSSPAAPVLAPDPETRADATRPQAPPAAREPIEILSVELRQSRSLDQNLSQADVDGDGVLETSRYSPVEMIGRYSPSQTTDLSLRVRYDILFESLADLGLSGSLRNETAHASFALVRRSGLGALAQDQTQLRLSSGVNLFAGKLRIDVDGSFDPSPGAGQKRVPDQRWRLEYYTQCCGFLAEYLSRDFSSTLTRREFRFTVDLRGIGKLLDLHAGEDR